jgi:hypothetical protein
MRRIVVLVVILIAAAVYYNYKRPEPSAFHKKFKSLQL